MSTKGIQLQQIKAFNKNKKQAFATIAQLNIKQIMCLKQKIIDERERQDVQ